MVVLVERKITRADVFVRAQYVLTYISDYLERVVDAIPLYRITLQIMRVGDFSEPGTVPCINTTNSDSP